MNPGDEIKPDNPVSESDDQAALPENNPIQPKGAPQESEPAPPIEAQQAPVDNANVPPVAAATPQPDQPVAEPVLQTGGVSTTQPQVGSVETPQPNSAQIPQPTGTGNGKKKRLPVVLAAIIALVLLVGGGAAAYLGIILPNKPENVLKQALVNITDIDEISSNGAEGEIKFVEVESMPEGIGNTTFELYRNDQGVFSFNSKTDLSVTSLSVDIRRPEGKEAYVKLDGLTGLGPLLQSYYTSFLGVGGSTDPATQAYLDNAMNAITGFLDSLNNQWYVIEESMINEMFENPELPQMSDEDKDKIVESYKQNEFLSIVNTLEEQEIHGVNSYQYELSIDKEKLKSFAQAIKDAEIEGFDFSDSELKSIDDLDTSKFKITVWISKSSKQFTQILVNTLEEGQKADFRLAIKDVDQEVNVEKPEDAKTIMELMGELQPLFGGFSVNSSPDLLQSQSTGTTLQTLGAFDIRELF